MGLFDHKNKKDEPTAQPSTTASNVETPTPSTSSPDTSVSTVNMDNNPFVEVPQETLVEEVTPSEPEVDFDTIFNASSQDLIASPPTEPSIPVMEETAATIDNPQSLPATTNALNVNPADMIGDTTKEDEITQIVSDSINPTQPPTENILAEQTPPPEPIPEETSYPIEQPAESINPTAQPSPEQTVQSTIEKLDPASANEPTETLANAEIPSPVPPETTVEPTPKPAPTTETINDITPEEVFIPEEIIASQEETAATLAKEANYEEIVSNDDNQVVELSSENNIEPAFVVPQESIMSPSQEESIISVPPLKNTQDNQPTYEEIVEEIIDEPTETVAKEPEPSPSPSEVVEVAHVTAPLESSESPSTPELEVPPENHETSSPTAIEEQSVSEETTPAPFENNITQEEQPVISPSPSETTEETQVATVQAEAVLPTQPESSQNFPVPLATEDSSPITRTVFENPSEQVVASVVEVAPAEEATPEEPTFKTSKTASEETQSTIENIISSVEEPSKSEEQALPTDIELPIIATTSQPTEESPSPTSPVIEEEPSTPIIEEETPTDHEIVRPIIEEDETVILPVITEEVIEAYKQEAQEVNESKQPVVLSTPEPTISLITEEPEEINIPINPSPYETVAEEIAANVYNEPIIREVPPSVITQIEENHLPPINAQSPKDVNISSSDFKYPTEPTPEMIRNRKQKPQLTERDGIVAYISDPTPTRFCNNCGIMLTDDSSICPSCGEPID